MNKQVTALVAGGLWLAGIALVIAVVFASHRQGPAPVEAVFLSASTQGESELLPAQEEMVWSSELEIPTVVVGSATGVTNMQRQDDLVVGPGVVTHP